MKFLSVFIDPKYVTSPWSYLSNKQKLIKLSIKAGRALNYQKVSVISSFEKI